MKAAPPEGIDTWRMSVLPLSPNGGEAEELADPVVEPGARA
jgi:hypothetical protein